MLEVKVSQSCLTLCYPMDYTGIKPRSPALQVDSLPAEPPGKPKNTENMPAMQDIWVRSLSGEDPLGKEKATHSSILA